jgi:hypothetical protein
MTQLLQRLGEFFGTRRGLHVEAPKPVQPLEPVARPMTGFLAGLTADQQKRALEYRGPDNFGGEEYRRAG